MSIRHQYITLSTSDLNMDVDFDGGTNPIYIGLFYPGTTLYQIFKLTWDASNNCTAKRAANNSYRFDKTWADRASYSY